MFYLRDVRENRDMTMKELGKRVGVSESAIHTYETGKRKVDYEMLLMLSEALDCSVLDLLFGLNSSYINLPEELNILYKNWNSISAEDKAIITIITNKYK